MSPSGFCTQSPGVKNYVDIGPVSLYRCSQLGSTQHPRPEEDTMARKTADVAQVLMRGNDMLSRRTEGMTPEFRQGVAAMLEGVLFAADRYKGFEFLSSEVTDPETGEWTGIREDSDLTRRRYL